MTDWPSRIEKFRNVSLQERFLKAREDHEREARKILKDKSKKLDEDRFNAFLDHCNTEIVPPNIYTDELNVHETCTRFGPAFIGNNRKLMIDTLDACREGIFRIWESSVGGIYRALTEFWENGRIKGAGTALPTMLAYLKDRTKFNVWIPFLSQGLEIFAGRTFDTDRLVSNYHEYNKCINESLRPLMHAHKPQEVDYILFRIGHEPSVSERK